MTDLASWLLEQIAEDERVARQVEDGITPHDQYEASGGADLCGLQACPYGDFPRRVLAECAAKRAIIERYRVCEQHHDAYSRFEARVLDWTLRQHAQTLDDRPGYQESWRP